MDVYVVSGYNGLLKSAGVVGVADTLKGAEQIKREHDYMLDEARIDKVEVKQGKSSPTS